MISNNKIIKKKFESQTLEILNLVVNSLYSNKDIFLRELISNSVDAIDKARFLSLTNKEIIVDEWNIIIEIDKDLNNIIIRDNGIGMTMDEVIDNIGTIAKSGTKSFIDSLKKNSDQESIKNFIGQFGVGFYSVFMVSENVTLETKKAGVQEKAVKWISNGKGEYSIQYSDKNTQGTDITINLKDDFKNYLEKWKIKSIIKKYSDFVEYPIKLIDNSSNKDNKNNKDNQDNESNKFEIINSREAIWLKQPKDLTEEKYNSFFAYLSHSEEKPLKYLHYSVEGSVTFTALIYIPLVANKYDKLLQNTKKSLSLYVNKIFITDNCKNLIPNYMRFLFGIIDSSDLSLNVSRELLQDNILISKIRNNITKKIINTLRDIKNNNRESYELFFNEFGIFIKEGIYSDYEYKDELLELLLFESLNNFKKNTLSLEDYINNMKSDQDEIYYITGENSVILRNSPKIEIFKDKGYDVLILTDPIDEFMILGVNKYKDKKLRSIEKGEFNFNDKDQIADNNGSSEKNTDQYKKFFDFICDVLQEDIKNVRFSGRLLNDACCIVSDENDYSSNMEKIMKLMNHETPKTKKILELNKNHKIIDLINDLFNTNSNNQKLIDYVKLLYNYAVILDDNKPKEPNNFANYILKLAISDIERETNFDKDK